MDNMAAKDRGGDVLNLMTIGLSSTRKRQYYKANRLSLEDLRAGHYTVKEKEMENVKKWENQGTNKNKTAQNGDGLDLSLFSNGKW